MVVSRSAANQVWPNWRAIGRRLQQRGSKDWHTVIGVVEDVMQYGYRDTPQGLVYFPMVGPTPKEWALSSPTYVIKTARAETIAPEVRALIREIAPEALSCAIHDREREPARFRLEGGDALARTISSSPRASHRFPSLSPCTRLIRKHVGTGLAVVIAAQSIGEPPEG